MPARVDIACPALTQLLTSGAALNASSRNTACGPPPWNATGMSRPIAAEGTIRCSTPSARAGAPVTADAVHRPAPSTTADRTGSIARIRLNARLIINLSCCRSFEVPPGHVTRVVVNHIATTAGASNARA